MVPKKSLGKHGDSSEAWALDQVKTRLLAISGPAGHEHGHVHVHTAEYGAKPASPQRWKMVELEICIIRRDGETSLIVGIAESVFVRDREARTGHSELLYIVSILERSCGQASNKTHCQKLRMRRWRRAEEGSTDLMKKRRHPSISDPNTTTQNPKLTQTAPVDKTTWARAPESRLSLGSCGKNS